MSFLKEITDYKNTVINRILSDSDLCKAISYNSNDFLSQPHIEDTSMLIYNNIYPYRFIPDIKIEAKSFITLSCTDYRPSGNSFKNGLLGIYMFTHRDLFKTDYGYTRVDYVLSKVEELMNSKNGIGIGRLSFNSLNEFAVNEKFQGYALTYRPVDFN
ncbi:hypothetical protein SAMN04487895_10366 [Paenibacillus sophorae]|uniref:Uncharacterized protein n=1 Tax=Paenibacillus sophorae TaxID=1333845 RepID=A0A1H8JM85_9BACL|nr:hypothetical protein [Paenibacillus sophorae]QWU13400.1 hypothetical protein KP014_15475 [Paenibacillus sophorae]SEN81417.1 hypothetical protein SAMN04487895_10366 [Paenibacillus sophorae]